MTKRPASRSRAHKNPSKKPRKSKKHDDSDSSSSSSSSSDSSSDSSSESSSDSSDSSSDNDNATNTQETAPKPTKGKKKPQKEKSRIKVIRIPKRRLDPMDKLGRWAVCSIDAFLGIHAIESVMLESLNDDYEPEDDDLPYLNTWNALVKLSPSLETFLKNANTGKGQIKYAEALEKVNKSVMSARQYHTGHIRNEIIDWINFDDDDPYLAKTPKSLRGINHPATRRLILPQRYVDCMYDEKFLAKLENGKVRIEATDWPAFLYDPAKADLDDVEQGLFTGDLLLHVFFAIFFGKSSALTGKFRKNSVADRNGMRKVTGRNIAYAAVQARFGISVAEKWDALDGHFNYADFYTEIVDFFEDYPDDKSVVDLLEWWNEQVFGHKNGRDGTNTPEPSKDAEDEDEDEYPPEPSSASLARAARKARNEKAKTGTSTPDP